MTRVIYWAVLNGAFALCLYFGVVREAEGAKNVVVFFTWLFVVLSFCSAFSADYIKESAERLRNPIAPIWFDVGYDIAVLATLVWAAWWWTAIAYFLHVSAIAWARDQAKKLAEAA
jgi:hypothetical protein